jgi:hypothetical protein
MAIQHACPLSDPLPQLQMVAQLKTPVLRAFRKRPPRIVVKSVAKASSGFNKGQQVIFLSY